MKAVKTFLIIAVLSLVAVTSAVLAKEQDDRGPLTKITFIHYKKDKNPAKPGGGTKPGSTACYGYLARGAKWKTTEPYIVNPTNSEGLSSSQVFNAVSAGVQEWDSHHAGPAIFGTGSTDSSAVYNEAALDNKNVVVFGGGLASNIIAVTNVWGYFGGAPQTRGLVEWDMKLNSVFQWGDGATNPALMDLQNIATHELGHSAGMDDLYTTSCNLETMYGYSTEGDTIKRDLNTGDITGLQALYQ